MGALLLIFLLSLYAWISFKVIRRARPWWGKALLVLTFILIPTADAVYGRIRLKQMCEAEGGMKIYKVVKGVDGFYAPHDKLYWLLDQGYQYVEYGADNFVRATRDPAGKVVEQRVASLDSQYAFGVSENDQTTFIYQKFLVKDIRSQEVLATSIDIHFYGGWAERSLGALYAGRWRVGHCEVTTVVGKRIALLITSVLIPTR